MNNQKASRTLNMTPFREVLGEDIPVFPLNTIGKYRLQQTLRVKFGPGYKNVGAAQKLLTAFDRELKLSEMGA